ncbi:unnamed protein product [Linum tenue]|uniref:F-box domain-containing protein n=1 Tax=Linum tenue TaxID=586396 RepID=A0AAV0ISA7_9ROSI|nr:unnamed protein product [Linum tenue]
MIRSKLGDPITSLEDSLVVEILIRLPNPRYSCRCKSVCKRWNSLISDAYFNRRFVSHHQSRYQPLLLSNHDTQAIIHSFPAPPLLTDEDKQGSFIVWDCFKDLVLCGFTDPGGKNLEWGRSYIICNPFTRQWVALPLAPERTLEYVAPCARLVAEARTCSATVNLDLGNGQSFAFSSEYRFRVLCMYTQGIALRLDSFCSESGKWTKDARVIHRGFGILDSRITSHNGEFLASYLHYDRARGRPRFILAALHPFRLDLPPTIYTHASDIVEPLGDDWKFAISQGALHLVTIERAPGQLAVWRLEEDGKSWRKQYQWSVNSAARRGNYRLECFFLGDLHPEKPEIVFLEYVDPLNERYGIYSCDLTTSVEEMAFFAQVRRGIPSWKVMQASVSCWPTPIPRYEDLRGKYDGSYNRWVQSIEATTPSISGNYVCS